MLQWGASYLEEKGFEESRLTIEILLSHVLNFQRIQLYTSFDKPLNDKELSSFKSLLQRRLLHEPLQYILGKTEFMGFEFLVDKRVLIPRPETEVLVEEAVRFANTHFAGQPVRILDIGSGSGCIAVSLAKMVERASVVAVDISPEAIEVAQVNAVHNGVEKKMSFALKDIFKTTARDFSEPFEMVVSNPPYISKLNYAELQPEIREFEPVSATTDSADGLSFFRRIADLASSFLVPGGGIFVEYAYDQSAAVQKIFHDAGWSSIELIRDYDGNPRCLTARKKAGTP